MDSRLRTAGLRYCIIGGIALQRWGEPRTTLDVDVTVLTDFGAEAPVVKKLLQLFEPRIDDAEQFALENRILLLKNAEVGLDISLGALPYESEMMQRASDWELGNGQLIRCCSAEDLVVQKAFADRDRDWADIASILRRRPKGIDRGLVEQELATLLPLKPDNPIAARLSTLFDKFPVD